MIRNNDNQLSNTISAMEYSAKIFANDIYLYLRDNTKKLFNKEQGKRIIDIKEFKNMLENKLGEKLNVED